MLFFFRNAYSLTPLILILIEFIFLRRKGIKSKAKIKSDLGSVFRFFIT